ncbi:FkbM family methyltransferase [Devosia sp.]|uniref:FkbM family methyltransferase n=1 Tax=Devosia sp. TaxID=1871048 RepID=UPI001ACEAE0D|nr:FkbM family methyltransferase [Devosia sp.]MBN9332101.1 FkbM family methyltransferase [Devosia sp.]
MRLKSGAILEFDYPGQFPPTLVMFGDFIDPEFPFLRLVAKPHWQVVDVGAAIGQFSMFAAVCLPQARVEAFEPSRVNTETLQRNIERNGVEGRVVVHQMALSNRKETARFATAPKTWMSQLLTPGSSDDADSELVAVDTLDAVAEAMALDHIHLLKINVAGFEPQVLEGAMETLRAGQVDVMVLLLGLASLPLYAAIAELGYRFFYYHPRQRCLFEVTRFDEDSVLAHRPWPARHILAIRSAAVADIVGGVMPIRPLQMA